MAQQPEVESRIARRVGLQPPRKQGAHQPAGPGGARRLGGRHPQQQRGDAGRLRRQRQPPARGQIEQARLAPWLDQNGSQSRATRSLGSGPQHSFRIARAHQQNARRVEAEFGQARCMQSPGLGIDEILPDPEDRALPRRPDGQPDGKPRRRGKIGCCGRIDLMQRRPREAATQGLVQRRRAEGHAPDRGRRGTQRRLGKAAPQVRQGERGRFLAHDSNCSLFVPL
ncbi:hypothetical protein SAMN04488115_11391 [Bosea lathyri]|uniref:Uncharacterized protein n=1 Tax=Bosea lathyri TaxID=1036778 RepID=A0A1H6CYE4_9HYPH|nr:hypothetical protein SAMN04488115_11391 [Bosea lathyri]